ncbi:MAG: hypothetical protein ABI900_13965 [Betaproteobacteria bacterium]
MTAHLIVRAQITDPRDKVPFDRWYQDEHLPQAVAAFHPIRAWRGWSKTDPLVHFAFYEYAELSTIDEAIQSEAMKGVISEFERMWGTRVPRAREVVVCTQMLSG